MLLLSFFVVFIVIVVCSGSGGGDVVVDSFTLGQFLSRQRNSLHGLEARKLKYLPKVCV